MKVKQVGEIHEPDSGKVQQPFKAPKIPKTKLYLYGAIGLFVIAAAAVLIYVFVLNKDDDSGVVVVSTEQTGNMTSEDIRRKELELKEKELQLKERQLKESDPGGSSQTDITAGPAVQVRKWIISLGKQDYSTAYNLMAPNIRPDYKKFTSIKGYGGITGTSVFSCEVEKDYGCAFDVIADYESIDPSNRNGRYKQRFTINNCSGYWEITKIQNISINFYN
jgi:hypothetical protein